MGQYDRIDSPFGGPGRYTNPGMVAAMRTYAAIKGVPLSSIYCYQGSFNTTVAASAGTHDEADCLDGSTALDQALMKKIGLFAWTRTAAQGFDPHIHWGRMYSTAMAWLATAQDQAYRAHRSNGLGNLSYRDSEWCPRYRGVRHLSGPTSKKYIAKQEAWGYSQAGCHSDKDADLKKTERAKGFILENIAGRVESNGSEYFVTRSATFYNVANFDEYVEPQPKTYYVKVERTYGYPTTKVVKDTHLTSVGFGGRITIVDTKTVYGTLWGYSVWEGQKRWWLMRELSTARPVAPRKQVGTYRIGCQNVGAQATGHNTTWRSRRARNLVRRWVASDVDVVLVQEFGSELYLDHADVVLAEESTLARVIGGGHWRHVVRNKATTKYVAADLVTLKTRADANGSQVALTCLEIDGVRTSQASYHFDVNASDATHRAQAEEMYDALVAFSLKHKVDKLNWTAGGDGNDPNGVVEAVLRSHGLVPALEDADVHWQSDKRTSNHWNTFWTVGPRLDDMYAVPGAFEFCEQEIPVEPGASEPDSDHNWIYGVRRLFVRETV